MYMLLVLVEDKFGVLVWVVVLFFWCGFNIELLVVGVIECKDRLWMIIVVFVEDILFEQIIKQFNKLINVIKIVEQDDEYLVLWELVFIKV